MVKRTISIDKYILAGIIASLIFILGFAFGFVIEKERGDYMSDAFTKEKIDILTGD